MGSHAIKITGSVLMPIRQRGVLNMMAILLDPVSEYRLRTLIAATGRSEQALLQEAITDSLESLQDQMGGDSERERRERGEDANVARIGAAPS
jgi:predicted DNA-binding protein